MKELRKTSAWVFSCDFYQRFQNAALAKHFWMTASANYSFLFVTSTSATKNVSFDLGYFKHFRNKHCELLVNISLWRS